MRRGRRVSHGFYHLLIEGGSCQSNWTTHKPNWNGEEEHPRCLDCTSDHWSSSTKLTKTKVQRLCLCIYYIDIVHLTTAGVTYTPAPSSIYPIPTVLVDTFTEGSLFSFFCNRNLVQFRSTLSLSLSLSLFLFLSLTHVSCLRNKKSLPLPTPTGSHCVSVPQNLDHRSPRKKWHLNKKD
jgi:hypothetical protein